MTPRYGPPPEPGRRYRRRPGVYAVLWRAGRILLTHQTAPRAEFQLPGGGIDAGETPLRALHREVFEETGWRIAAPLRLGAFRRYTFMPEYDIWAEKLCIVYLARPSRPLGPPTEAGHTAHWIRPEQAVSLVGNPGDAEFVRRTLRKFLF